MNEFLQKVLDQFKNFFSKLDPIRQFGFIAVALIVISIMVGIVRWAGKTRYQVLFSDLNKEDSTMMARLLEEKKVSYLLSEDGKSISVPEDQVEIWRLEIAKQGLSLTGTVGYEVFDKQAFGTSSYVQRINKQRALEGELVKTITYIKGVKRARVHLSIPETSPFAAEQKPPSGSVIIDLNEGVTLNPREVRGIALLVASSVDGLRPESVVIINERGKRLTDNMGDEMSAETSNRIALEAQMGRQLEQQIEGILSKVVGEGKVVAKVTVKMDFTEELSTETTYDSENAFVLSEVSNSQKLVGSRPSPQGIPGARSNLPGEQPQPGIPETKNDVDKKISTKNYNVPSKVTKKRNPTARIKHVSVAVMVDGKQIAQLDAKGVPIMTKEGIPAFKYEAWSEEDIKNFQEIVSSSIGLDKERGDNLVIRNMQFIQEDLSAAEAIMRKQEQREVIKNVVKYLAVGLILTLFFVVVVRPFIQWVTENTVESIEDFLPKTLEELEKIQTNQKLPGLEEALPQIEEKLNPEKIEGNMLREKIVSLVEENPAKAAQIVSSMIHQVDSEKQIA